MKSFFSVIVALLSVSPAFAVEPAQVAMPLQRMYAVDGFDSNDVVQIMFEGYLPNTCYRAGGATARVNPTQKVIEIFSSAYYYNGICLEVIVPFEKTVTLGPLPAGRYSVVQRGQPGAPTYLGEIQIRAATSASADDYMYAPVKQVWFRPGVGGGQVVLAGAFPVSCMVMEDIRVSVGPSTIVVQPIAKMVEGRPCRPGRFPFEHVVAVPGITGGRYALHVRAMDGQALNLLVDFLPSAAR